MAILNWFLFLGRFKSSSREVPREKTTKSSRTGMREVILEACNESNWNSNYHHFTVSGDVVEIKRDAAMQMLIKAMDGLPLPDEMSARVYVLDAKANEEHRVLPCINRETRPIFSSFSITFMEYLNNFILPTLRFTFFQTKASRKSSKFYQTPRTKVFEIMKIRTRWLALRSRAKNSWKNQSMSFFPATPSTGQAENTTEGSWGLLTKWSAPKNA